LHNTITLHHDFFATTFGTCSNQCSLFNFYIYFFECVKVCLSTISTISLDNCDNDDDDNIIIRLTKFKLFVKKNNVLEVWFVPQKDKG
jgi:hypothetical protein